MSKPSTILIYLTGKPGVGKYTIAKALAQNKPYIICDNQLINNPIFELLNYDGYSAISPMAWSFIARIRDEIFDFLSQMTDNSYILTNNLFDDKGDRDLYESVKTLAQKRGSLFIPVRLNIEPFEHAKRVVEPQRRDRWKSIDVNDAYDDAPLLPIEHPYLLELNITSLTAKEAADKIEDHISAVKKRL